VRTLDAPLSEEELVKLGTLRAARRQAEAAAGQ
jgi:hypothetical protein